MFLKNNFLYQFYTLRIKKGKFSCLELFLLFLCILIHACYDFQGWDFFLVKYVF